MSARAHESPLRPPHTDLYRTALGQVVLDMMKPLGTGLVVIFAAFSVFNIFDLPDFALPWVLASDLTLVALFAGTRFVVGRNWLKPKCANVVTMFMAPLILSNILLTFSLLGSPVYVTHMCITVIGAGCVMLSPLWFGLSLALSLAMCLGVFVWRLDPVDAVHYSFALFAAGVLSGIIHLSRLRTYRRLFSELKERRLAEQRYRDLVEGVDAIVWEAEPFTLRFTFVSHHAEQMLGYPVQRWLDDPGFWPSLIPEEERDATLTRCMELTEQGINHELEYRMIAQDGSSVWVRDIVRIDKDKRGYIRQIRGVMIDISESKRAEEETLRLEEQLRQSQKLESIGTLAGGVAHDFNNLLAGILGYADILREAGESAPKVIRAADMIVQAAERAAQLTKQLLGFARKGKLRNMPVDLNQTIRESVEFLGRMLNKNIRMKLDLDRNEARILGDPDQLSQVFVNLAVNARDAMPGGGDLTFQTRIVYLDEDYCRRHVSLPPGDYVMASVSDSGEGIALEIRDRLFEPFFTTKGQGEGTGMGLAMVYGIVKNHGGAIEVYSEPGVGTCFKIYLPLHRAEDEAPVPPERPALTAGTGRILVVDDEAVVREMATDMLERLGYEVLLAEDGQIAVDLYREHAASIDLAIIDMVMPRLGGRDCFREMKKINPDLKAFLSTGFTNDGAVQEILDEGMLGCTPKPYRMRDLSEAVASAMAGRRFGNGSASHPANPDPAAPDADSASLN